MKKVFDKIAFSSGVYQTVFIFLFTFLYSCQKAEPKKHTIWFKEPAEYFEEALPLGNGRIGAMIYGGVEQDQILLNEGTLWSGKPVDPAMNPEAYKHLPAVREALFSENYELANQLIKKLQGSFSESYQPVGTLFFDFGKQGQISDYRRKLDLESAVSTVEYTTGQTQILRESFVSFPDQVMVVRFSAKGKVKLSFSVKTDSPLPHVVAVDEKRLTMTGNAPVHVVPSYWDSVHPVEFAEGQGMQFCLLAEVAVTDGQITQSDSLLQVDDASFAEFRVSVATSFNGFDKDPATEGKDEKALAVNYLIQTQQYSYDQLKERHIRDFQSYYNRVRIDLGESELDTLSTPERLMHFSNGGDDNDLAALYFQFGRYLLISSSRPGSIPANLQGIWNAHVRPIWSSNYTTNINVEMNYWPAEVCNLSEMHEPLIDFTANLAKTGEITAKTFYDCGGWCCHHNTDIWAMSNPVGDFGGGGANWANWNMAGVWISTHLWEHFAFTRDTVYLREKAWPLMKGAAQFCLDYMVPGKDGYLLTAPSTSPENKYLTDQGVVGGALYGATADYAMMRELFSSLIEAEKILEIDPEFSAQLSQAMRQFPPYKIGRKGNIREWYYDWEDEDPTHRHMSHLFGLYPGHTISLTETPELAEAAERTLLLRTNVGTGWSIAWKMSLWAHLKNPEMAYDCLKRLLNYVDIRKETGMNFTGGGAYANLFDAHPPFQIDGNFGGTAGIAEMLLQSGNGEIELLPALPQAWKTGRVSGLRARGGYTVDMEWENGSFKKAIVVPDHEGHFKVRVNEKLLELYGKRNELVVVRNM
ncbi:glycoside hydrolase family 95 protein [Gaoshiqia sediminis]|uniref:Glycoside hydrolase family 95 protein n=1 Tax=Gaoshiqia sediminis TaxID=2986998 RepID=A0AA42C4I7_9BACT|nr:glycoside hydrolase family 95 protein [Gaoshiqia sediminis]MCW0481818.1 glycoside hydrolase family 95 protein [Gaoshiqia sediminis]